MNDKDGGPAFPQTMVRHPDDGSMVCGWADYGVGGMSLRDYFAAAALSKLLAWDFTGPPESASRFPLYAEQAAKTAYAIGDAMLAEREK